MILRLTSGGPVATGLAGLLPSSRIRTLFLNEGMRHSLPCLPLGTPSTPFEPEGPSGIPAAMIFDHVAVVSTGVPPSNGGRGPRRSRQWLLALARLLFKNWKGDGVAWRPQPFSTASLNDLPLSGIFVPLVPQCLERESLKTGGCVDKSRVDLSHASGGFATDSASEELMAGP
jgi:hypothetical protein